MTTPTLLNDDGTASMATCVMMSHHGLRRDLKHLELALSVIASGEVSRAPMVQKAWQRFQETLHGHHQAEDTGMFPNLAQKSESARATIAKLEAEHRRIDPLLAQGDAAFADLSDPAPALALVTELEALLTPHLELEEHELIPLLRDAKAFPAPPNEEAAALYADGFAWAMYGVAAPVIERVHALLPEILLKKLPAACAAFAARHEEVWGPARAGATFTAMPDFDGPSSPRPAA